MVQATSYEDEDSEVDTNIQGMPPFALVNHDEKGLNLSTWALEALVAYCMHMEDNLVLPIRVRHRDLFSNLSKITNSFCVALNCHFLRTELTRLHPVIHDSTFDSVNHPHRTELSVH